jgi:hypothetical protein
MNAKFNEVKRYRKYLRRLPPKPLAGMRLPLESAQIHELIRRVRYNLLGGVGERLKPAVLKNKNGHSLSC